MKFQKKTCKYCGYPIGRKEHGNRIRCRECSATHHRNTSRFRQRIIRQVGNQGLKNYQILETITSNHNWETPFVSTIRKLTNLGFDFSRGGNTHNTDDVSYPRVFVVVQFEVYYVPNSKTSDSQKNFQSVIIKYNINE